MIRQSFKCLTLAFLSTLPVRDVQESQLIVFFVRDRGSDAGIHAARDETDGELWTTVCDGRCFEFFSLDINGTAHYTPLTSGPQMYLCSCNCMWILRPLAAIQSASCCRSTCPQAGEIRSALVRASRSFSWMMRLA